MQSWRSVELPQLPGTPPPLLLWDTAIGGLAEVGNGPQVTMYVCGITPYDATHLGHALTYVTFDTLVRVLRDAGREVAYVQNVTDVDEPLFERAERDGLDWRELGSAQIDLFRRDNEALRNLPPTAYVGAMEAMPQISAMVGRLIGQGGTYRVGADTYADVAATGRLGWLSHSPHDELVALARERGGDPDREGKRDPVDPVIWRGPVPGEPAWSSPAGEGRPGWHIECAAIALHHLGAQIDIQGGGVDLVFPHHELGSLQAECATGEIPFARLNVHVAHLAFDGEKMSKSRGNLVFVSRLLAAGVEPAAIRLALHAHHHRTGWEWTDAALQDAGQRLATWREALAAAERAGGAPGMPTLTAVRAALADDLDTPAALAALDQWAEATIEGDTSDPAAAPLVRDTADALLGVDLG